MASTDARRGDYAVDACPPDRTGRNHVARDGRGWSRRGKGKSDPIDAHLAVLTALRLNADRLPTPRADGDREALRILLSARDELTTVSTAQTTGSALCC